MPPPLPRECILKRQKIPVAAEVLKATDHLLHPPPSLAAWTHPAHTPFSLFAFYAVESTVRPLQTTINMSVPDDRVGPRDVLYKLTSTTAH